jgi:hypothetical protein
VIDNVVWTDYWLSIAGAGCGLTGVGAGEEQARRDRKACVEAKQVCGRWASVRWSDDKDFRFRPRGACIPN